VRQPQRHAFASKLGHRNEKSSALL
jgi:hypothetical protein